VKKELAASTRKKEGELKRRLLRDRCETNSKDNPREKEGQIRAEFTG